MRRLISTILIAVTLCGALFCLFACDRGADVVYVDYGKDNAYEYERTEDDDAVTYMPIGAKAKYGLLFYVGTAIAPEFYAYLAEPLARQGYAVVISKVVLAYFMYKPNEPAFEKYPDVEFFIGGHSQGGGATVRRAQENMDMIKGVILYAPLCLGDYTLKDSDVPTLLLEAKNDGVLNADMKSNAKTRLPDNRTEYMLEGCHMSFSSYDSDGVLEMFNDGPATEAVKAEQKEKTCEYTMAFMRSVLQG